MGRAELPSVIGPYTTRDRKIFLSWLERTPIRRFLVKSFSRRMGDEQLFVRFRDLSRRAHAQHRVWALRAPDCGSLVGHAELKRTKKTEPGELELVYIVADEFRSAATRRKPCASFRKGRLSYSAEAWLLS